MNIANGLITLLCAIRPAASYGECASHLPSPAHWFPRPGASSRAQDAWVTAHRDHASITGTARRCDQRVTTAWSSRLSTQCFRRRDPRQRRPEDSTPARATSSTKGDLPAVSGAIAVDSRSNTLTAGSGDYGI